MTDTTRADFEYAYSELHEWDGTTPQFEYDESMDSYVSDFVQTAWWAWETATQKERERCALVCEKQIKIFLSPQYKTGQPLSSFGERHAAASCADAIRMPPTGTRGM